MKKDLTTSSIDRQNILNNPYALSEIQKATGVQGIPFEGRSVVLKEQAASFFEVTVRTIENYLEQNTEELAQNGYEVVTAKRLKELKLAIQGMDDPEIDFGIISKTARLGVFDFKAFLNLAMLMRESERAQRETGPTLYWLKLLKAAEVIEAEKLKDITREANEQVRILTSIVKTSQLGKNS